MYGSSQQKVSIVRFGYDCIRGFSAKKLRAEESLCRSKNASCNLTGRLSIEKLPKTYNRESVS